MNFALGTIRCTSSLVRRIVRARADLDDLGPDLVDLDPVADLERPFDEEDQSGDEVLDDVLQPEADADAERRAERGQRRRADAEVCSAIAMPRKRRGTP
jgi:hypothetical protein